MSLRILVIRLSALGDFVLSFQPFAAIRAHHPHAEITLLTTRPFVELAAGSPWFDRVIVDTRPALWDLAGRRELGRSLRGHDLVYDLQTSARSNRFFARAGRPAWSGNAPGSRFRQGPHRETMHTIERQRDQLERAGIADFPPPDLSWLTAAPAPELPSGYAVLVPGAAPSRPAKRWPVAGYAALAATLVARGITPVVVGRETDLGVAIAQACPGAIDLTGRTGLAQLFGIFARARLAVGNDTGPMHVAASVGCPSLVLFSGDSDPGLTAPRLPGGGWPAILRVPVLADLAVARVVEALPLPA